MLQRVLFFFLVLALFAACQQDPKKKTGTDAATPEASAIDEMQEGEPDMGEEEPIRHYCFASRAPTPEEFGNTYNYQFTRLQIGPDGNVTGTIINAPYGTDGSRGSLTGIFQEDRSLLQTTTTFLAEGELYQEQRDYKIEDDGLATLSPQGTPIFTIPSVSCEVFDSYVKEFHQGILKKNINTADRSRLKKVTEIAEFGFTEQQLDNLRFMELEVDLDNNYETREFLLYIMDPMVCGSGGCNLFVINGDGDTLSKTTVVKLPIYMPTSTTGDMDRKKPWKSLYVWSQGFRELVPENGRYPLNASSAKEVPEDALTEHPENFRLVMDYLE
jgi:hypothetical protein